MTEALPGYRKLARTSRKSREEGAEVRNQERGNKEQHLSQRQNQPGEEGGKRKGREEVKERTGGKSMRARVWPRGLASPQEPGRCVPESQSQAELWH